MKNHFSFDEAKIILVRKHKKTNANELNPFSVVPPCCFQFSFVPSGLQVTTTQMPENITQALKC
jgi:hypothetical protein